MGRDVCSGTGQLHRPVNHNYKLLKLSQNFEVQLYTTGAVDFHYLSSEGAKRLAHFS